MEINIKQEPNGVWNVTFQDKLAKELTYDEMLGLISSITMPSNRPCLQWLKTEEQRYIQEHYHDAEFVLEMKPEEIINTLKERFKKLKENDKN